MAIRIQSGSQATIGPNTVTDGLVLYLDAANTKSYVSGSTTWTDLSSGGNNGTLTNGPTFDPSNGGSIVFDGVDDSVPLGQLDISNIFTVNCWVKLNSTPTSYGIVFGSQANGSDNFLGFTTNNRAMLYVTETSDVNNYSLSTSELNLNQWYNLTYIVDVSYVAIYVNGILRASNTRPYVIGSWSSSINFIGSRSISQFFLNGEIGNFQLYNKVLNTQEILQNYNSLKGRYL
jgi:hypothetical protein